MKLSKSNAAARSQGVLQVVSGVSWKQECWVSAFGGFADHLSKSGRQFVSVPGTLAVNT